MQVVISLIHALLEFKRIKAEFENTDLTNQYLIKKWRKGRDLNPGYRF